MKNWLIILTVLSTSVAIAGVTAEHRKAPTEAFVEPDPSQDPNLIMTSSYVLDTTTECIDNGQDPSSPGACDSSSQQLHVDRLASRPSAQVKFQRKAIAAQNQRKIRPLNEASNMRIPASRQGPTVR